MLNYLHYHLFYYMKPTPTPLVVWRCCCKLWPNQFWIRQRRSIRNKGSLLHDLIQCSDLDILGLVETHIRPTDTDGLQNSLTPLNYNLIQKPRCTGLGGGVGVENPSLPVLSLHRFLDHLKSLYYLLGPTTIALSLLVCIVLPILVLLNFWKIFWLFLAFFLQLVLISSFVVT